MKGIFIRLGWWWHCLIRFHRRETITMSCGPNAGTWTGCHECGVYTFVRNVKEGV